ncbi:MAG: hypothetical protein WDN75_14400 [Bacteroidota bacterium]
MDKIQVSIVEHFKENHERLLRGASMTTGNVQPGDIVTMGEVKIAPSGDNDLEFTASFKVGPTTVSYFGTIDYNLKIVDEAVSRRNSDGTLRNR